MISPDSKRLPNYLYELERVATSHYGLKLWINIEFNQHQISIWCIGLDFIYFKSEMFLFPALADTHSHMQTHYTDKQTLHLPNLDAHR